MSLAPRLEGTGTLAASEGVSRINFQASDIHGLLLPDNALEIVHVHQVLQHIAYNPSISGDVARV